MTTKMTTEELAQLDPATRELWDQVAPMMRAKGIDPNEPGVWQDFAKRVPLAVEHLNAHRKNTVALYKRMAR